MIWRPAKILLPQRINTGKPPNSIIILPDAEIIEKAFLILFFSNERRLWQLIIDNGQLKIVDFKKRKIKAKFTAFIDEDVCYVLYAPGIILAPPKIPKKQRRKPESFRGDFLGIENAGYNGVNQQVLKFCTAHGSEKMITQYFTKNNEESRKVFEEIYRE